MERMILLITHQGCKTGLKGGETIGVVDKALIVPWKCRKQRCGTIKNLNKIYNIMIYPFGFESHLLTIENFMFFFYSTKLFAIVFFPKKGKTFFKLILHFLSMDRKAANFDKFQFYYGNSYFF